MAAGLSDPLVRSPGGPEGCAAQLNPQNAPSNHLSLNRPSAILQSSGSAQIHLVSDKKSLAHVTKMKTMCQSFRNTAKETLLCKQSTFQRVRSDVD